MATDVREQIRTVEEIREKTTMLYAPVIMAIKNKVKYSAKDADVRKYQSFDVDKDSVKAEILTTEQTEKSHIKGATSEHVFNIYLAGAKAMISFRNKYANLQKSNDKVIKIYSQLFDTWGLGGDRGNNGLLISTDKNFVTNSSKQISAIADDGWNQIKELSDIFTSLLLQLDSLTADNELIVYTYGDKLASLMASVNKDTDTVVKKLIMDKFEGKSVTFIHIPSKVMPKSMANDNGIVILSQNATALEYCQEPTVKNNGTNDEDEYYWANYELGSVQVSCEEEGGVIKQPLTFA